MCLETFPVRVGACAGVGLSPEMAHGGSGRAPACQAPPPAALMLRLCAPILFYPYSLRSDHFSFSDQPQFCLAAPPCSGDTLPSYLSGFVCPPITQD